MSTFEIEFIWLHKCLVIMIKVMLNTITYRIAGNLNFREFRGCSYSRESFLREIGGRGVASFGCDTSEQSAKVFSAKILLFAKVFSLESFPLYGSRYKLKYIQLLF